MLRRDADSCFWIGRYMERAACMARMIDVQYHFVLEGPSLSGAALWRPFIELSGDSNRYYSRYAGEDERHIIDFFGFDPSNDDSIISCLTYARENGRGVRELISSEMWECLNTIYLDMRSWSVDRVLAVSPHDFFEHIKNSTHLFMGIVDRTLMFGESRDFLEAGLKLERAHQTARILDVRCQHLVRPPLAAGDYVPVSAGALPALPDGSVSVAVIQEPEPVDVHGWTAVLKSVGAYEAYRKTYRQGVSPVSVTEFLVMNPSFPASVLHCIADLDVSLRRISQNTGPLPANAAERAAGRLSSDLNFLTAEDIIAGGLSLFLQDVQYRCQEIGDAVRKAFLEY